MITKESAKTAIISIEDTLSDNELTIDITTYFLYILNKWSIDICENEYATPAFIKELKLAYKNFVGETE